MKYFAKDFTYNILLSKWLGIQ